MLEKDITINVTQIVKIRKKYYLKTLVEKIPEDYRAKETDWGEPVGNEAW